jgi:hypothetical protein
MSNYYVFINLFWKLQDFINFVLLVKFEPIMISDDSDINYV